MILAVNNNSVIAPITSPLSTPKLSYFNCFTSQLSNTGNEAWFRFKDLIKNPTELGKSIRALAHDPSLNTHYKDEDRQTLIQAFTSSEYPQLIFFISKIINQLDDHQLQDLIKKLFVAHGIENSPELIKKMKGLFSLQKIEGLIRTEFPLFTSTEKLINDMNVMSQEERESLRKEFHRSLKKTAISYLHKGIEFILNMLIYLMRLKQFLPEEQQYQMAESYVKDMQYQAFLNNVAVFSGWLLALSAFTGNVILSGLILGGAMISIGSVAYIYHTYFKPPPENLPLFRNLSLEAQNGELPTVYGRDAEIQALIDTLCSNNETTRRHPILTGQTRVGKTEIINGLAHRINAGLVPEFKDKRVLFINTAAVTYAGTIDKILKDINGHESEYIFFFDEFHTAFSGNKSIALINRFKSMLDPGKNGLKYCIFATTKNEFTEYFSKEAAMLARLSEIPVNPLGDDEILTVLQEMVKMEAPDLVVDLEAIKTVARVHRDYPEYEGCSQPFTSKVLLSQVLAKSRNYVFTEEVEQLRAKKNRKLVIQSEGTSLLSSDLLFSESGHQRTQEIMRINQEIQELEKQIDLSKSEAKVFLKIVSQNSRLRVELNHTAAHFPKNPTEYKLQDFILRYFYLQNAFHRNIHQMGQKYPLSVVSHARMLQHIEAEVALKKSKAQGDKV